MLAKYFKSACSILPGSIFLKVSFGSILLSVHVCVVMNESGHKCEMLCLVLFVLSVYLEHFMINIIFKALSIFQISIFSQLYQSGVLATDQPWHKSCIKNYVLS